jgi:glycosyltransferase involved in cell wall biosynthesis
MPKVSVIIPNYNHARYLRQRIDTVLGQTFQDFEVILMDDCSTDESRSIISEYANDSRVRIELSQRNSGSTFKQWNKGVELAKGEYIWIAESDDYAEECLLERLVPILEEDSKITFAYVRSWQINAEGQKDGYADLYLAKLDPNKWAMDFHVDGREECGRWIILTNPVPNASAVVFRKSFYQKVGGADERLRMCGDWKLWAALALEGNIAYVGGDPLNYYRIHEATVRNNSQQIGVDVSEALEVIRWISDRIKPTKTISSIRDYVSGCWLPAMLNGRISLDQKRVILRAAMAMDPHAVRRLIRPGLVALRMTVGRRWRSLRGNLSTPSKSS